MLNIPLPPNSGDRITAGWARSVIDYLRRTRISVGPGMTITVTPSGIVLNAKQQPQQTVASVSAAAQYPYGREWAFGFVPIFKTEEETDPETGETTEKTTVTVQIYNAVLYGPTWIKTTESTTGNPLYIPMRWDDLQAELLAEKEANGISWLAVELTVSPQVNDTDPAVSSVTLKQFSTSDKCMATRDEIAIGIFRWPIYEIKTDRVAPSCRVTRDLCHGLNTGLM